MFVCVQLLTLFLLVVGGECSSARSRRSVATKEDVRRIFESYDKTIPPSTDSSTEVKIGAHILSFEIDDVNEEMTVVMYFRQSWTDSRLSGFGKNAVRLFTTDDMWLPDVFFRNEKQSNDVSGLKLVRVTDGNVWYVQRLKKTFACQMHRARYPTDTQSCSILIESFGYTMDVLRLGFLDNGVDIDTNIRLNNFLIKETIQYDCSQNYTTGSFPCLEVKFIFERRHLAHLVGLVYLPSTIIVLMSTAAFWLPADNPTARLLVGVSTTLAMTLFAAAARWAFIRHVSDTTSLDVWLIFCFLLVFGVFVVQLAGVVVAAARMSAPEQDASEGKASRVQRLKGSKIDLVGKILFLAILVLFIIIYAAVLS